MIKSILAALLIALPVLAQGPPNQHWVALSWTDTNNTQAGVTWNVYRASATATTTCPTLAASSYVKITPTPVLTGAFLDLNLAGGTFWCYTITAVLGGAESAPSAPAPLAGVPSAPFPPPAPSIRVN